MWEAPRQIKPGIGIMPLNVQNMSSVNDPIGYSNYNEDYIVSECYRVPMAKPLWLVSAHLCHQYQPRGMFQKVPIPHYTKHEVHSLDALFGTIMYISPTPGVQAHYSASHWLGSYQFSP